MQRPDTLLEAAKRVADAAGLPWADVQACYLSLQPQERSSADYWLPKSVGRAVWYAHPNLVARLLIGLAGAGRSGGAAVAVQWARDTTPNGRKFRIEERPAANVVPPIEQEFAKFLTDPDAARQLAHLEFRPDQHEIVFTYHSGEQVTFAHPVGRGENLVPRGNRGIIMRGIIAGSVFVTLAESVRWKTPAEPPFRGWINGQDDGG